MTERRHTLVASPLAFVCAAGLLAACAASTPGDRPPAANVAASSRPPASRPFYGAFGIDTAGMDRSVKPGDDFYRYVNGRWQERTEIPPDRASYGMFDRLAEEAARRTQALVEAA